MARTSKEIMQSMLENLPDKYSKEEGTVVYDLLKPPAIVIKEKEAADDEILKNAFFESATEEYQEKIALDRANITKKEAVASSGKVKITGQPGMSITEGDKVASDVFTFSAKETKTMPEEGTMEVLVECDTTGKAGNIPIGAIKEFPVTISGMETVTNEAAFENGYDKEDSETFKKRYYEKIREPTTSGNVNHYIQWAKEVTGVGDARALARTPRRGSVTVIIINAEKTGADETLRTETFNHIEEERPVGADVVVSSATEVKINVSVKIVSEKDVKEAVKTSLKEWLKEKAFKSDYISYAKIGEQILNVEGVQDLENLKINGDTKNISIAYTEVAVLGVVTFE